MDLPHEETLMTGPQPMTATEAAFEISQGGQARGKLLLLPAGPGADD